MSKDREFEHESYQDNLTISKYFQSLIEGFENGKILLQTEEEEIAMYPNDLLKFSIKAKTDGDKSKLTLKISWKSHRKLDGKEESVFIGT